MQVQKLTYNEYWGYYWRVVSRHAIPGIFDWDRDLVELIIKECNPPIAAEILDLGCAGGDQARLFTKRGYNVTGIDQVPKLIEYAKSAFRKEGLQGHFIEADFREMDYCNQFNLCVMLSGTFGSPKAEEDLGILKRIYRALRIGGRVFIDYLASEEYSQIAHSKTWQEIEGGIALVEEWYHAPTSTYRSRHRHILYDGRIIEAADENGYGANEIIRCYTVPEIESLAMSAGLKVFKHLTRKCMGNPSYQLSDDEPRGIVILEKGK